MRWSWALLVAAGCGFDAITEPGSNGGGGGVTIDAPRPPMIDAPTQPTVDAPVDVVVDAPIDAPAPQPMWTVVDTLMVSCRGTPISSTFVLQTGVNYRLQASGECIANTVNSSRQDAEYLGYNVGPTYGSYDNVDNGIAINNPDTDSVTKQPAWGAYTSTHAYEVSWVGLGAPITATFHETVLSNNSGSLTLRILALQ